MKARLLTLAATLALASIPAAAAAAGGGTAAGLRVAVTRFVQAELSGDGAGACGVLYAPLTATVDGRTCAQRWDARLSRMLATRHGSARLHADLASIAGARIEISGLYATIALPHPLLNGRSRFYWTANCWMLTR